MGLKQKIGKYVPDSLYLRRQYKKIMGKPLNLKNPHTFNEKLQWLKLHDRNPLYITMVDKYAVKKYVADMIGEEYIVPTLGVWDKFDDINFGELPDQFVLKCTHDSGGVIICKDKSKLDIEKAKEKVEKSLKTNYYLLGREWPYKDVPRKIIAEEFLDDNGHVPVDYKVYCFNGNPYKVMLCLDRDKDEATKFYSFDKDWNLLRHNRWGIAAPENFTLPKPASLGLMFEFAAMLSKGMPFVRVDFYELNRKLYFGELTLFPDSGFDNAILPEIDLLYGEMINLDTVKK